MHDVFVVTSQNWDGGRITRVIHAANQDDARRTHRANYPDESIAAVATRMCAADVDRESRPRREAILWGAGPNTDRVARAQGCRPQVCLADRYQRRGKPDGESYLRPLFIVRNYCDMNTAK